MMGGMVCVAAALAYLALLNQMRVHEELVDDGVHIDATFRPRPSSAVLRVLGSPCPFRSSFAGQPFTPASQKL